MNDIVGKAKEAIQKNAAALKAEILAYGKGKVPGDKSLLKLSGAAYGLMRSEPKMGLALHELALSIEYAPAKKHLYVFCNALWASQHDNTGLPVDVARNKRFLEKCLPYGPHDPAIYFNGLCMYVEMNDFDQAAECALLAEKHKYNNMNLLLREVQTASMFKAFQESSAWQDCLAELRGGAPALPEALL